MLGRTSGRKGDLRDSVFRITRPPGLASADSTCETHVVQKDAKDANRAQ